MSDSEVPDLSDIGIPSAAGAGALAIYMLVGPSLRAVGNAFGDWTDYRVRNLLRIGEKAGYRAQQQPEATRKPIHPRLAHDLIEEASWIDDDLQQEYCASLLANASQTPKSAEIGYYLRILSNLSPSQTALHYAVYRAYSGSDTSDSMLTFNRPKDREKLFVHASLKEYERVTKGTLAWASAGLQHEGLIGREGFAVRENRTYAIEPTPAGALLYWLAFDYPDPIDSIRWTDEEVRGKYQNFRGANVDSALTLAGPTVGSVQKQSKK